MVNNKENIITKKAAGIIEALEKRSYISKEEKYLENYLGKSGAKNIALSSIKNSFIKLKENNDGIFPEFSDRAFLDAVYFLTMERQSFIPANFKKAFEYLERNDNITLRLRARYEKQARTLYFKKAKEKKKDMLLILLSSAYSDIPAEEAEAFLEEELSLEKLEMELDREYAAFVKRAEQKTKEDELMKKARENKKEEKQINLKYSKEEEEDLLYYIKQNS